MTPEEIRQKRLARLGNVSEDSKASLQNDCKSPSEPLSKESFAELSSDPVDDKSACTAMEVDVHKPKTTITQIPNVASQEKLEMAVNRFRHELICKTLEVKLTPGEGESHYVLLNNLYNELVEERGISKEANGNVWLSTEDIDRTIVARLSEEISTSPPVFDFLVDS